MGIGRNNHNINTEYTPGNTIKFTKLGRDKQNATGDIVPVRQETPVVVQKPVVTQTPVQTQRELVVTDTPTEVVANTPSGIKGRTKLSDVEYIASLNIDSPEKYRTLLGHRYFHPGNPAVKAIAKKLGVNQNGQPRKKRVVKPKVIAQEQFLDLPKDGMPLVREQDPLVFNPTVLNQMAAGHYGLGTPLELPSDTIDLNPPVAKSTPVNYGTTGLNVNTKQVPAETYPTTGQFIKFKG